MISYEEFKRIYNTILGESEFRICLKEDWNLIDDIIIDEISSVTYDKE